MYKVYFGIITSFIILFLNALGYGGDNFTIKILTLSVPIVWLLTGLVSCLFILPGTRLLQKWHPWLFQMWLLVLFGGITRLLIEIPMYGIESLRGSIFFLGSVIIPVGIYLGFCWKSSNWRWFVEWPVIVISLYTLSFPWRDLLFQVSPKSGMFREVPLLGFYNNFDTVTSALWAAYFVSQKPVCEAKWLLMLIIGLFGISFVQSRLTYFSVIIALITIIFILNKSNKIRILLFKFIAIFGLLVVWLSYLSFFPITGRYGKFDLNFFKEHFITILGKEGPASGSVQHRYKEYPIALSNLINQPLMSLFVGNGLSASIEGVTGIFRRVLHNDYIDIPYRAGLIGFLWIIFVLGLFFTVLAVSKQVIKNRIASESDIITFAMICSMLAYTLLRSMVEPVFFWAYGALPFYFWSGLALGVSRRLLR